MNSISMKYLMMRMNSSKVALQRTAQKIDRETNSSWVCPVCKEVTVGLKCRYCSEGGTDEDWQ